MTFRYGSGSSDPYLWLKDPELGSQTNEEPRGLRSWSDFAVKKRWPFTWKILFANFVQYSCSWSAFLIRIRIKESQINAESALRIHADPDPQHMVLVTSVSDPQGFQCGPGSGILGQCRSGGGSRSGVLMIKIEKNCNLLIPRPHEGQRSYRRSLQPSKENIQHFKIASLFLWVILPSWIRMQPTKSMRLHGIRIRNAAGDIW